MRVTLIYNPVSGGGAARVAAARAAAAFRAAGHDPQALAWGEGGRGATELARAAAEAGADRVVAIGGDGTAVDVASGLLGAARTVPMAHVPRGTANVLALNLGIPPSLDAAIEIAVHGVETRLDVGALRCVEQFQGEEPFLLSVGTGLHAEIVERAHPAAKRRWGVFAYVMAGWRALGTVPLARYRLLLDGEEQEAEATMVQVVNMGALFRASWRLAPGISPVDGRLDVLVYRARRVAEYVRVGARILQGEPTATDFVLHRRVTRVRIEAAPDVRVQRDGELAGETPAEVVVWPRALSFVVPRGSRWAA